MPGEDKALTTGTGRMKNTVLQATNSWDVEEPATLLKGSSQVASIILLTTHSLALLPLFLIVVLQDVHLKLVTVLNTTLMILITIGNFAFYRMRVVKVYPKLLDTFLLVFYASMIPLVYLEYSWIQYWICVYHHAVVAGFMWLSILLPIWDHFGLESLKDYLPEQLWQSQATHRASMHASQVWAAAVSFMALAALGPTLSGQNRVLTPIHIVCNYVLGLLPLLAASAVHRWLFNRCIKAASEHPVHGNAQAGASRMGPLSGQHAGSFHFTAESRFNQARHTNGDQLVSTSSNGSSSWVDSDVSQRREPCQAGPDRPDGFVARLEQLLKSKRAAQAADGAPATAPVESAAVGAHDQQGQSNV